MSPGYVRIRPDLLSITAGFAEDALDVVLTVTIPLLHGDLAVRPGGQWRDWRPAYRRRDVTYPEWIAPDDRQCAVLATADLRVPVPDRLLPVPTHLGGPGLLDDARKAVRTLAELINEQAGPSVARFPARRPAGV